MPTETVTVHIPRQVWKELLKGDSRAARRRHGRGYTYIYEDIDLDEADELLTAVDRALPELHGYVRQQARRVVSRVYDQIVEACE